MPVILRTHKGVMHGCVSGYVNPRPAYSAMRLLTPFAVVIFLNRSVMSLTE